MLDIEYFDDGVRIESDHYYVFLDKTRGGTITKYGIPGEDSIIKREGVQVHLGDNNGTHFEQEYSNKCNMKVIDVSKNNIHIRVTSKLVDPNNLKNVGAECDVTWFFGNSNSIISSFIVKYLRNFDYNSFSRYIIANPNFFDSCKYKAGMGSYISKNIPKMDNGSDRLSVNPSAQEISFLNNNYELKSTIIGSCWHGDKQPYSESTMYYSWSMQELIHYSIINRKKYDNDIATIEYCLSRRDG